MALRVVWSGPAQVQRLAALKYWWERNGNSAYSRKLDLRFRSAVRLISRNPKLGRPSSFSGVRVKSIGDYLLFYRVDLEVVVIAALWDNRQDPKKLKV